MLVRILPLIGMSESSGPHTFCQLAPNQWNPASVGKDMTGVHTKIFQPDKNGEGEVCTDDYDISVL